LKKRGKGAAERKKSLNKRKAEQLKVPAQRECTSYILLRAYSAERIKKCEHWCKGASSSLWPHRFVSVSRSPLPPTPVQSYRPATLPPCHRPSSAVVTSLSLDARVCTQCVSCITRRSRRRALFSLMGLLFNFLL
jgi:hypothetical protein